MKYLSSANFELLISHLDGLSFCISFTFPDWTDQRSTLPITVTHLANLLTLFLGEQMVGYSYPCSHTFRYWQTEVLGTTVQFMSVESPRQGVQYSCRPFHFIGRTAYSYKYVCLTSKHLMVGLLKGTYCARYHIRRPLSIFESRHSMKLFVNLTATVTLLKSLPYSIDEYLARDISHRIQVPLEVALEGGREAFRPEIPPAMIRRVRRLSLAAEHLLAVVATWSLR